MVRRRRIDRWIDRNREIDREENERKDSFRTKTINK
jgi:hypothetical protein